MESIPERLAEMLYEAATSGRDQDVRSLLLVGADINKFDHNSLDDDQYYTLYSYPEVVRALLQSSTFDPRDDGNYPMLFVCQGNNVEVLKLLLLDGRADPNVNYFGRTPLAQACRLCHKEIVKMLLLDGRADPSALESEALLLAADSGCTKVVSMLLNDGRVNAAAGDNEAILLAMESKSWEIVQLLMKEPRVYRTIDRDLSKENVDLAKKISRSY